MEGKAKVEEELKRADAVVLTYACDQPETLKHLQKFWLPEIRRLKVLICSFFYLFFYCAVKEILLKLDCVSLGFFFYICR